MPDTTYPKWVQREPHIGAVLCLNAIEEQQLLEDWAAQKLATAQAELEAAQQAAAEAEAAAKVTLKTQARASK